MVLGDEVVVVVINWERYEECLENGMPCSIASMYQYHFDGYKFKQEGTYITTEPRHQYTFWDAVP